MKRKTQTQPEISPFIGLREAARLLGVCEARLAQSVPLPDGSLGCKPFPSLTRIQDVPPAAGTRGSKILFVREQVLALAEQRRRPPQVSVERVRQSVPFSDDAVRELMAMGKPGMRLLRMKI